VNRMLETESEKLVHMEDRLKVAWWGRTRPLVLVANAVRGPFRALRSQTAPSLRSSSWVPPASARRDRPGPAEFLFNDDQAISGST